MDINNNTNVSSLISSSISKLNLNAANKTSLNSKNETNEKDKNVEDFKQQDIALIEENNVKNKIDVDEIQKYAEIMGEKLTVEDINYGIMYGRSVIADYSA